MKHFNHKEIRNPLKRFNREREYSSFIIIITLDQITSRRTHWEDNRTQGISTDDPHDEVEYDHHDEVVEGRLNKFTERLKP